MKIALPEDRTLYNLYPRTDLLTSPTEDSPSNQSNKTTVLLASPT
jgi:hypothetical protein